MSIRTDSATHTQWKPTKVEALMASAEKGNVNPFQLLANTRLSKNWGGGQESLDDYKAIALARRTPTA